MIYIFTRKRLITHVDETHFRRKAGILIQGLRLSSPRQPLAENLACGHELLDNRCEVHSEVQC